MSEKYADIGKLWAKELWAKEMADYRAYMASQPKRQTNSFVQPPTDTPGSRSPSQPDAPS